jgi:hypothetical protein
MESWEVEPPTPTVEWLCGLCGTGHPLPPFFASVDSTDFTAEGFASADSAWIKVALFSASWEWLASADSKEVTGVIC